MPVTFSSHEHDDTCIRLRPLGDDDDLFHIGEWSYAVGLLRTANVPTVAFFVLRHLAELVLKRIVQTETGTWPLGHNLEVLLNQLVSTDPLRVSTDEYETTIRDLIKAVGAIDPAGDAGRYAFRSGSPSFDDDACVVPDELPEL